MTSPDDPAPPDADDPFIEELRRLMQADEDREAVYGWMVEECSRRALPIYHID